jgi:hypothetical protein
MTPEIKKALDLALEALRSASAELYRASSYCNTYEVLGNTNDAITAIQQAIAAPVQKRPPNCGTGYCSCVECVMEPAAQPAQQEPINVAQAYAMAQVCLDLHDAIGCKWGDNPYLTISQLKAATAAPVQEPFGWWFTPNGEFLLPTEVEVDNPRNYETYRAMYIDTPPAQPAVPAFNGVATKKLDSLIERGYQINGLSFEQTEDGGAVTRGAITCGGMVLWWNQTPAAQQAGEKK